MNINPLKRKERIYIVDCSDSRIRAVLLQYGNQEIFFEKYWEEDHNNLGWFLKKIKPPEGSKVIFLHGNSSAATFAGSVKFEKNDGNSAISEGDLFHLFSKAGTQFFNRFNEEAKKRLGLDEITLVLASSRIFDLKLDGQSLVSPIGIKAKLAEINMEQTFLSREVLDEISACLPQTKNIFHIETSAVICDTFNSLKNNERAMFANVLDEKTRFFFHESNPKYFGAVTFPSFQLKGEIPWGSNFAVAALSDSMGINNEIALKVIDYFKEGKMSEKFAGAFLRIAKLASQSFFEGLAKFGKNKKHVFVITGKPLPFLEKGRDDVTVLRNDHLSKIFNCDISYARPMKDNFLSPIFALGLIAYLRRTGDNYLKGFTDKKLKWLQPENSI